jgi:glycosyltransferase involved in cell wall biosynthesis
MEKIAIISFSYIPYNVTGAFRIMRFVKYLPQYGFQPIVFTAKQGNHHLNNDLLKEIPQEAIVYRIKSLIQDSQELSKKTSNLYQRRDNPISGMLLSIIRHVKDLFFSPDVQIIWALSVIPFIISKIIKHKIKYVLVTGGPFSLFISGIIVKKICNIKLLLDFRDPWVEFRDQKKQTFIRQFQNKWMEKISINDADAIIVVTKKMIEDYIEKYHIQKKITLLYNCYDEKDYINLIRETENESFTFFYSGLMEKESIMYDPTLLIDSFVGFYLKYPYDVKLVLCGNYSEKIEKYIKSKDIKNKIYLTPFQNRDKLLILQNNADCLIHFHYPQKTVFALSIKLFEYAQMNKPIITINTKNAESSFFIEQSNLGLVVENDDMNSIISAFFETFNMNKKRFIENINYDYIKQYNCQNQVKKLAEIIESMN